MAYSVAIALQNLKRALLCSTIKSVQLCLKIEIVPNFFHVLKVCLIVSCFESKPDLPGFVSVPNSAKF